MSNAIEEKENLFLSEIINQRKQSANFIIEKYIIKKISLLKEK
jgi:hypothetical protein